MKKNGLIFSTLELIDKEIEILSSAVLFDSQINCENFGEPFITYNSSWKVEDGWISGKNAEKSAGMAIMREDFPGKIKWNSVSRRHSPEFQ